MLRFDSSKVFGEFADNTFERKVIWQELLNLAEEESLKCR